METEHTTIQLQGAPFHVAMRGSGPLVILCHGFPELWYSWRWQIEALAAAGFRVAVPDLRGYGHSYAPADAEQYNIMQLVGDLVALVRELGSDSAHLIGHDWGAALAWNAALMRPDLFRTVAGISVPFQARHADKPPLATIREITARKKLGDFYMVRFQEPGIAEAEYERDLARTFRIAAHVCTGTVPAHEAFRPFLQPGESLLGDLSAPALPPWLSERDLAVFIDAYRHSGFRGPLNWYRNLDRNWELTAPFQDARIHQPALYITGERDQVRAWASAAELNLARTVPGLTGTLVVPGAGHWVHQEEPQQTNDALLAFLCGR